MSQEKVDRHKAEKRNVKKTVRKEKMEWRLTQLGLCAVTALLAAWIGVSVYNYSDIVDSSAVNLPSYTVNTDAVDTYLTELYES